jgi:hypothetical protein
MAETSEVLCTTGDKSDRMNVSKAAFALRAATRAMFKRHFMIGYVNRNKQSCL